MLFHTRPTDVEALHWLGPQEPAGASVADMESLGARIEPTGAWGAADDPNEWTLLLLPRHACEGTLRITVGDWLIRFPSGNFAVQSDAGFRQDYMPGPSDGRLGEPAAE